MPVNGRLLRSQQVLVVPRRTFTGQHANAPVLPHAPAALPDLQAELLRTQAELNERETTFNVQRTQLEAALTRRSAEMDAALVTARAAAATVHAEAAAAMQEAQAEAAAALAAAAAQAVDLLELSAADARADGQALAQRLVLAAEDQVAAIRQSAQAAGFITGREEGRSVGEAGTQLVLLQAQRLIVEAEGWRASLLAASGAAANGAHRRAASPAPQQLARGAAPRRLRAPAAALANPQRRPDCRCSSAGRRLRGAWR